MTSPLTSREAVLLVARREFTTQVRSRSFVIGLLITLVLFGGIGLFSAFVAGQTSTQSLGLTPDTVELEPALVEAARTQDLDLQISRVDDGAGREQVDAGDLDGLLTGSAGDYELLGRDEVGSALQSVVDTAVQQRTLGAALTGPGSIRRRWRRRRRWRS